MINRLKSGDQVTVTTGTHKNKSGKILRFTKNKERAFVEGVNVKRRHYPSSPTRDAGIEDVICSIHVSNLMLIINNTPTKVKVIVDNKTNKLIRVPRKGGK